MKDIHKIDNSTQDRIRNFPNFISKSPPFHQNINRYGDNIYTNRTGWIEFQNPYFNNYLTKNFDSYYPNNEFFPYTDFNSIRNDEKEFRFTDLFKITIRFEQAVPYLSSKYPKIFIEYLRRDLICECSMSKSEEPLNRFLRKQ